MIMANEDHSRIGREFEEKVMAWFEEHHNVGFSRKSDVNMISIGKPPKKHEFDVVSEDRSFVIECKCFTWTITDGMPSGKMKSISEAVLRLSFISNAKTFVVIKKSYSNKRKETLAEYYYRRFGHMLRRTRILEFEYDDKNQTMREIVKNEEEICSVQLSAIS